MSDSWRRQKQEEMRGRGTKARLRPQDSERQTWSDDIRYCTINRKVIKATEIYSKLTEH